MVQSIKLILFVGLGGGRGRSAAAASDPLIESLEELLHLSEVLQGEDQNVFVQHFVPWAIKVMNGTPVKLVASSNEHRTRHGVLAILKIVAGSADPLRPFLDDLMGLLIGVLRDDNEDNGVVAIHVLIDLHKVHRVLLEAYAQPLVDYVLAAFESFSDTCEAVCEVAKDCHIGKLRFCRLPSGMRRADRRGVDRLGLRPTY